jgi:hypothetical protein
MSTEVLTLKVRFSYVNVFEPKASQDGGEPKYGVTLLIPKTDTVTIGKIRAAMAEAAENFRSKNGAASLPQNPLTPLHDGDGDKPNGGPYEPECAGHWVLACSNKQKPLVVDEFGTEISGPRTECTNPNAVYSGCYGRAKINFYGYNNRRKGIGCGLLGIKKLHDGEPFGGSYADASDFEDGWTDPEAGAYDFAF